PHHHAFVVAAEIDDAGKKFRRAQVEPVFPRRVRAVPPGKIRGIDVLGLKPDLAGIVGPKWAGYAFDGFQLGALKVEAVGVEVAGLCADEQHGLAWKFWLHETIHDLTRFWRRHLARAAFEPCLKQVEAL